MSKLTGEVVESAAIIDLSRKLRIDLSGEELEKIQTVYLDTENILVMRCKE